MANIPTEAKPRTVPEEGPVRYSGTSSETKSVFACIGQSGCVFWRPVSDWSRWLPKVWPARSRQATTIFTDTGFIWVEKGSIHMFSRSAIRWSDGLGADEAIEPPNTWLDGDGSLPRGNGGTNDYLIGKKIKSRDWNRSWWSPSWKLTSSNRVLTRYTVKWPGPLTETAVFILSMSGLHHITSRSRFELCRRMSPGHGGRRWFVVRDSVSDRRKIP